jgi:flagellar hook-associated protein 3 FlgL
MITRVTTMTMMHSSARHLQSAAAQLARAQERASGFQAITRPSDDPSATASAIRVRAAQQQNLQYARNIQDGNGWLATIDASLNSTTTLIGRARDLTLQGANDGAMSATQKEAIATELESIRDLLLAEANTSYLGRNVFAGTSDAGQAFSAGYAFEGGQGVVERRIGEGATVRVDADGGEVFGVGDDSVFAAIDRIAADLRAGVNVKGRLDELDAHRDAVLAAHSGVGARHATVLAASKTNLADKVDLETTRSGLEDLDVAETAIELQMHALAHQAALSATARALRPTLMDFLA